MSPIERETIQSKLKRLERNINFLKEHLNMTGFRNLIIHVYSTIDLKKVYEQLQESPNIFTQFLGYFQKSI